MTRRELLRLPLGKYYLEDGIYHYSMSKSLTKDKSKIYLIKDELTRANMYLFEKIDDTDEYKRIILTSLAHVGGLSIRSEETFWMLRDLKFKKRGSFKKFASDTNLIEKEQH